MFAITDQNAILITNLTIDSFIVLNNGELIKIFYNPNDTVDISPYTNGNIYNLWEYSILSNEKEE